jgi:hypothetical protein
MSLRGPSKTVVVEPLEVPAKRPQPEPRPAPAPKETQPTAT